MTISTPSDQRPRCEESRSGRPACRAALALLLLSLALLPACATSDVPPLEAMDRKVDLERFMGDWYVIGFIPIEFPFFSEAGAHNGVESYRLTDEGVIETTYTFRDGAFDGPEKRYTPKGWVYNEETHALNGACSSCGP
jgi:apolipoprotein D and lipocalin family protein